MGSNGTVEERLAEAEAARAVLGAAWRVNLRWPDRAIGSDARHVRAAAALVRRARPRAVAIPYGVDRHPDHVAASRVLTEAVFNAGLRRYDAGRRSLAAGVGLLLLHQRFGAAVVRHRRVRVLRAASGARCACHVSAVQRRRPTASVQTRLTTPLFQQLVESRDAQFGALAGVRSPRV